MSFTLELNILSSKVKYLIGIFDDLSHNVLVEYH